jgi:hypothetical protein
MERRVWCSRIIVGKEWRYAFKRARLSQRNVTVRVLGLEPIQTAAGSFNAFKLEKNVNWSIASGLMGTGVYNIQIVYFYSEETKSIVKVSSEELEVELLKFGSSDDPLSR